MAPLDLRYSRFKLIRLAFVSLVFAALGLWLASGAISAETARRGPGGWIGRLLGPEGLQYLGWAVMAATAALALLFLRRAFADPVAARADADGVTINTVFGSHFYPAADLGRLELHYPGGQPILQIIPPTAAARCAASR